VYIKKKIDLAEDVRRYRTGVQRRVASLSLIRQPQSVRSRTFIRAALR